ncbi:fumarylacetoacetate hydrolase family protein [Rhodoplanes sp. Z2-YC6860]|uniref:fumarylacetoacetate hydrolase family protein n=1 Tax=Rhodoplanes sp. Z2-YC6860 TaxID=674703 RepID=UPI00078DD23D|nr:fumarylacetoacetate hydrolase family protein [Rhodoplanes sp. Z2-YC6860]AMN44809.1 4-oxalocrotonate decarboxylase [Rhodoplanes sp. Z2-YC6860]
MSATLDDPRIAAGMRAQMDLRKHRFNEGARQVGWKVGFGAPAAMQKLKLTAPVVGFILDRAMLPSGGTVSLSSWQKPAAEAEIAAYIGHDLPATANRDDVRRAVVAIGPAIELADVDSSPDDVEGVLAGNIFQRHVILGQRDIMRQGARLQGLKGRLTRSGENVPVPADLQTNTGDILNVVRHVADVAAAVGDGLRAGQFVICGSLTAPMLLERSDTRVDFALEPIAPILVNFTE